MVPSPTSGWLTQRINRKAPSGVLVTILELLLLIMVGARLSLVVVIGKGHSPSAFLFTNLTGMVMVVERCTHDGLYM